MTYLDLIRDADRKLDMGDITLGEYEEMIKPLSREIQPETATQNVGEWIPHRSVFGGLGEKVYTCDKCGYNIGFQQENYCPNCGVKMNNK